VENKKRKILVKDHGFCHFHNMVELAKEGHEVWVNNTIENDVDPPFEYYKSLGITILDAETSIKESLLRKFVDDNGIDTIINERYSFKVPQYWKTDLDYIGLNTRSGHLESRKLWCRTEVSLLGVNVPDLLDEVKVPCVVKPKRVLNGEQAQVILKEDDLIETDDTQYIEEYIGPNIETNLDFIVSGGKYSISYVQSTCGEAGIKDGTDGWWINHTSYDILSVENRNLTLEAGHKILEWVASLGGSFMGHITGLVKDGKWYFCEINARGEMGNSTPIYVTGNQYLEAMLDGKPQIIGDARNKFYNRLVRAIPKEPDSIYPFHLHEKYGVRIPCGLDIIDGEYRSSKQWRCKVTDDIIGIVLMDEQIPEEFFQEIEATSDWYCPR
tara:strand:- start:1360 stop:2511 length:1152 start_codon:yes stop_codon:yes gene_type:complete